MTLHTGRAALTEILYFLASHIFSYSTQIQVENTIWRPKNKSVDGIDKTTRLIFFLKSYESTVCSTNAATHRTRNPDQNSVPSE